MQQITIKPNIGKSYTPGTDTDLAKLSDSESHDVLLDVIRHYPMNEDWATRELLLLQGKSLLLDVMEAIRVSGTEMMLSSLPALLRDAEALLLVADNAGKKGELRLWFTLIDFFNSGDDGMTLDAHRFFSTYNNLALAADCVVKP